MKGLDNVNDNKYLQEEKYQRTKAKLNNIASIMLTIGAIMFFMGLIMIVAYHRLGFGIFIVIGLALVGFGAQAKMLSHGREITGFLMQQQMPITKEGLEDIAPSIGKVGATINKEMASSYGEVAKEISKGIKEGLNSKNNK